jgi:MFS transporter, SHS family, lactate transporter
MHVQYPHYLAERFPTEVRATASGFVYHQGAIWGGLVGPGITYAAVNMHLGFAIPMLVATTVACFSLIFAMLLSPETKGQELKAELVIA